MRCKRFLNLRATEREYFCGLRRRDSERAGIVAVDFQHFDFEDEFADRIFEIVNQCGGDGDCLRRSAHGDGAAAGIEIRSRDSGDFADEAEDFRHLLGGFCCRQGHSAHDRKRVVLAFLRGVFRDEEEVLRERPPERAGLLAEQAKRGGEIEIVDVEANDA